MKKVDNLESSSESEELVTREEIKDTPFHIIGVRGEYFGSLGRHRITEPKKQKQTIKKELEKMTWNRIVQVILILTEVNK